MIGDTFSVIEYFCKNIRCERKYHKLTESLLELWFQEVDIRMIVNSIMSNISLNIRREVDDDRN